MQLAPVEMCKDLIRNNPVLEPILAEHLKDMDGEFLPYLLLADVARYVEHNGPGSPAILSYLNDTFQKYGQEIDDLIGAGFMESIDDFEKVEENAKWKNIDNLKAIWSRLMGENE